MRLFIAIDLLNTVKDQVLNVCADLSGVRWVQPAQLHLTLRFIGETDQAVAIINALRSIRFDPFPLQLQGLGQFPAKGAPRVLWIGCQASEPLTHLAASIETTLTEIGLPKADQPFKPHLTLARPKYSLDRGELRRWLGQQFAIDAFTVTEFVLFSSQLDPKGAIYRREAVFLAERLGDRP
ncbi:MAG: RNA 2',3'-cyclic phosphodiesterase [Anaerolineae bacterium]|jgi:2'-5' RNA ligase|nr:RNA 2',3'-cyclic phosphodiesterase [Anaerolineae bacterium]